MAIFKNIFLILCFFQKFPMGIYHSREPKNMGLGALITPTYNWDVGPALELRNCVISGKSLDTSKCQFLHLKIGIIRLLYKLNEIIRTCEILSTSA